MEEPRSCETAVMEPLYHILCYLFVKTSLEAEALLSLLSFVSLLVTYSDLGQIVISFFHVPQSWTIGTTLLLDNNVFRARCGILDGHMMVTTKQTSGSV